VIKESLAQPAHQTTRELRGLQLYRDHAEEIRFENGVWLVPSQNDATSVYEVVLGRRGESCECADYERRVRSCKHIAGATIARAKTGICSGCGQRFKHRDLVEVAGDDNLTFFEGDALCHECAIAHGVL
jgi:hypothetical protein